MPHKCKANVMTRIDTASSGKIIDNDKSNEQIDDLINGLSMVNVLGQQISFLAKTVIACIWIGEQ